MLVTSTPPTPNGDLHLGHLSGPYLAADVLVRLRRRSGSASHLTGIDDHQSYVTREALRSGAAAEEVADRFGGRIRRAWAETDVQVDHCWQPRAAAAHVQAVRATFRQLVERGDIVPRVRPLPYCERCRRYAFEGHVGGGCPHCEAPSGGNACERCARPNDCADLTDPRCTSCGTATTARPVRRLYLRLDRSAELLQQVWSAVEMPDRLRAVCDEMAGAGLPEIAVTHPTDWGIPVPVPGFGDQRIYVWFEMAPGYVAATAALERTGQNRCSWTRPDAEIVQCFGIDNGYFHAVLFPAILGRALPGYRPPDRFVVNELYRLEGSKFSTSRRHAIWVLDALDASPSDALRWFLASDRPAACETSFSTSAFERFATRRFAAWSTWVAGAAQDGGDVDAPRMVERALDHVDGAYADLDLPAAAQALGVALDAACRAPALPDALGHRLARGTEPLMPRLAATLAGRYRIGR